MCEYCDGKVSKIPTDATLKFLKDKDNNYIKIELETNCNRLNFKSNLICESAIGDKCNRMILNINYCPICGRKLNN